MNTDKAKTPDATNIEGQSVDSGVLSTSVKSEDSIPHQPSVTSTPRLQFAYKNRTSGGRY